MIKKGWIEFDHNEKGATKCLFCSGTVAVGQLQRDAINIFGGRGWQPCSCGRSGIIFTKDAPDQFLRKDFGGL